jgi:hypothetical protein
MGAERRHAKRHRVEYLATMLTGGGRAARYCLVTEMSDGGIRINASGYTVPDEFALRLTGNAAPRHYRVIWRINHDVGAMLIDVVPAVETNRSEIRAE